METSGSFLSRLIVTSGVLVCLTHCIDKRSSGQVKQIEKSEQTGIPANPEPDTPPQHLYSNPVLIYGSSFLAFFRRLFLTNQFEKMADFTCEETLSRFGREKVLAFYQSRYFNLSFQINKLTNMYSRNDTIYLTYLANVMATSKKVVVMCKIQNDSCKILLPSLSKSYPAGL
jgi:hypothetical protein